MRPYCASALLIAGFCTFAPASTLTYNDTKTDNSFATAPYQLIADGNKNITTDAFGPSDSGTNTSNAETADSPHMLLPNDGSLISLAAGATLTSAIYDLSYTFDVTAPRTVTNADTPHNATLDPTFTASNTNLQVLLVFQDATNHTLKTVDVTSLGASDLDLTPYLLGLLPGTHDVATNFDSTGITIKTAFSVDNVIFSASIDTASSPDRNVEIDYNVKEGLNTTSSVTLNETGVPEPASFALIGMGLAAFVGLRRKFSR
jgi:hypothetical protein